MYPSSHRIGGLALIVIAARLSTDIHRHAYGDRHTVFKFMPLAERIFASPWFRRLWTLQEASLARPQRAFIICGRHRIPWDDILRAAANGVALDHRIRGNAVDSIAVHSFLYRLMEFKRNPLHKSLPSPLPGNIFQRPNPELTRRLFPNFNSINLQNYHKFRDMLTMTIQDTTANTLLRLVRRQHCSDPKDKIFALAGVLHELGIKFPHPDYSKPLALVYCEAASMVIRHDDDLDILRNISSPLRMCDLPSWVPDWRTDWGIHRDFLRFLSHPCEYLPPRSRFYTIGSSLFTEGKVVDKIKDCASPLMIYDQDAEAYVQKKLWAAIAESDTVYKIFQQWFSFSQRLQNHKYPTGESTEEAFKRTIMLDIDWQKTKGEQISKHTEWFTALESDARTGGPKTEIAKISAHEMGNEFARGTLERLATDRDISGSTYEMLRQSQSHFFKYHCGKRFFITDAGYMGLAEFSVEVNDVIAVISGQNMPVVLRPKATSFEFVAVAYVHGMMEDEAWPEWKRDLKMIRII